MTRSADPNEAGTVNPEILVPRQEIQFAADSTFLNCGEVAVRAAVMGITDVVEVGGKRPQFDTSPLDASDSMSDMLEAFRLPGGQIDADRLYGRLERAGVGRSSPFVLYTAQDLKVANANFIFGFAVKESGISVQSVARFISEIRNESTLARVIRHISRHEFGHMLGLDGSTIKRKDDRGGLASGHCANECTMYQVCSTNEAVALANKLDKKSQAGFCNDCADILLHR